MKKNSTVFVVTAIFVAGVAVFVLYFTAFLVSNVSNLDELGESLDDLWEGITSKLPTKTTDDATLTVDDADEYSKRGWRHLDAGNYDFAIKDATTAIKLYTKFSKFEDCSAAYVLRGAAYAGIGEGLEKGAHHWVEGEDPYSEVKDYVGIWHTRESLYKNAIADYTQAIRLNPSNAVTYFSRGRIYHEQRAYDKAIADYKAALRIDPYDAWGRSNMFNAYFDKGDVDMSLTTALEATKILPYNWLGYDNLGYGYEKKGNIAKAKDAYLQAERLAPNPNPYLEVAYYNRPEARKIMGR